MKRPSPALVIALLALFVAVGGTSYAALTINGKNIKKRTIAGSKLKKNTLSGKQIKEARLRKVPAARRADSADRADSAGRSDSANRADIASNSEKLGGKAAGDFAESSLFARAFTTGERVGVITPTSTPVFQRGPFKVSLKCQGGMASGNELARAYLSIEVSEDSYNSFTPPVGTDKLVPAGTSSDVLGTGLGRQTPVSYQRYAVSGGYIDTESGKSLDFSARLRVGRMGVPWCSSVAQATFGGL